MNNETPRLRMFAGPNGSGKSTLQSVIRPELLGTFINPDFIEKEIREHNFLDLKKYNLQTSENEILSFFSESQFLKKANLHENVKGVHLIDDKLVFSRTEINSYFASVIADFIRQRLLGTKKSFSFETVMSFPDKIEFLHTAQSQGYRTYLYYIATDEPSINITRVKNRVKMGGHFVPEDKIISRYQRSLGLLGEAVQFSDRAYIFDNSTHTQIWLAEITDGKILEMKTPSVPEWFNKALGRKFKM